MGGCSSFSRKKKTPELFDTATEKIRESKAAKTQPRTMNTSALEKQAKKEETEVNKTEEADCGLKQGYTFDSQPSIIEIREEGESPKKSANTQRELVTIDVKHTMNAASTEIAAKESPIQKRHPEKQRVS